MAWRNLFITNKVKLSLHLDNLIVKKEEEEISIPIEDISSVVLDETNITITGKVLQKFCDFNVLMIISDEKHLPNGILFPFGRHSRQLKILKYQMDMTEPFRKRIWQKIVKQKLINQNRVLELTNIDSSKYLLALSKKVDSGDKGNIEASGAGYYFGKLFDKNFTRRDPHILNGALNYGYAIIRSHIVRTLSVYGYACSLGVFHKSELNEFNLADDLIECFRGVVDLWVISNADSFEDELSTYDKASLLHLVNCDVILNGKYYSVNTAIDEVVKSFTSSIMKGNLELFQLPEIIPIREHEYE